MNQTTINDEQRLQLNGFEQTQEVRDQSNELMEADFAELDRIAREEPVCTLEEIWKELGCSMTLSDRCELEQFSAAPFSV